MSIEYTTENRIAFVTINRPESGNALDKTAIYEFNQALSEFQNNPELRAAIITGTGDKAFCSGFDLKKAALKSGDSAAEPLGYSPMEGLEITKPLIAAVNGAAVGGGLELALMCDLRAASENAIFGMPEVLRGLIPGWGGTQRLPGQVPWCHAAEMIFTGKSIDAGEAYRIGLINAVVPRDKLMDKALEWARQICRAAPLAVQAAKEAMLKGSGLPLEEGLAVENSLSVYLNGTEDFREGIQAFREKREPDYKGR